VSTAKLPERVIITDDPLRARVLVSHHLESATQLQENGDFFILSGSYKGISLSVVSSGSGKDNFIEALSLIKQLGALQVLYISTCISTTDRYDIKSLILGAGGCKKLTDKALDTLKQQETEVQVETIGTQGVASLCIDPSTGGVSPYFLDDVTAALYDYALINGIEALSLLTVSENVATGVKMEESEIRSRLYPASGLAFEIMVNQDSY